LENGGRHPEPLSGFLIFRLSCHGCLLWRHFN
jgi:hypothetical protein